MKILKELINYICYIFTVLVIIITVISKTSYVDSLPFEDAVITLLLMSIGTAAVIVIRDRIFSKITWYSTLIGFVGCAIMVLIIGYFTGWIPLNLRNALVVCIITVAVYLCVWAIAVFQNKKDADSLNESLKRIHSNDKTE